MAPNVFLRDMNLETPVTDERRIEVVANGLPLWHGAQVAVDTTLVSPLRSDGAPRPHADQEEGVALREARRKKRRHTYPELRRSQRCRLVVLALETGGRWSEDALEFLRSLARAKARTAPRWLRAATAQASASRWSALLAMAAQRALAASLLELPLRPEAAFEGEGPSLSDLLADARWESEVVPSRLPLRA